jgi:NADH dehydrogenase FAD-containing subunit
MNKKKTIAIIGAGFAGAALAKAMEKRLPDGYRIGLISKDNFITYNPLLAEVVGASIPPAHTVAPVRQIVKKSYCYMVDVPEMDAYALPLKTLGDALFLRNRIMLRLEQAELQPDPELKRWLTTFIVIGGGFSGVDPTAQYADHQGKALAKNIINRLEGLAIVPFGYSPLGALSTIGHNKAVAEVLRMKFSGLIGFLMWRGAHGQERKTKLVMKMTTKQKFLESPWPTVEPQC